MTWVLFVIVYATTAAQTVGITSVPGYTSQDCQNAREELRQKLLSLPRDFQIQIECIPGPGSNEPLGTRR
jgi:hypothetical protein